MDASNREGKKCARGLVKYDLQEKLHDKVYFEKALEDDFEAIYHKVNDYKEQEEYRLTVINENSGDFLELSLDNDNSLMFDILPIKEYGKNIIIEISDLEFDPQTNMPIRFSAALQYAEPIKIIESQY